MKKDIEYFSENEMLQPNLIKFHENLPNGLKDVFKDSIKAEWVYTNVLQGYMGPKDMCVENSEYSKVLAPQHGVQEIRYWWGMSKLFNAFPILGSIVFGIGRAGQSLAGRLEWSSLFFDIGTGECLGTDINTAAFKLNEKGCKLFETRNFSDSLECHKRALELATEANRQYSINIDKAQAEVDACNANNQGVEFLSNGKYDEALVKFEEACSTARVKECSGDYAANKEKAQRAVKCAKLNSMGEDLLRQGELNEALNKFKEACKEATIDTQRGKFLINCKRAEKELEVESLCSYGDGLFQNEQYVEAAACYTHAYTMSKIESKCIMYQDSKKRAQNENDACILRWVGDNLFNSGQYQEALMKYQEAYNKSSDNRQKDKYFVCCETTESEIIAAALYEEGNDLFSRGEFENALEKYQQAFVKSTLDREKDKYRMHSEQTQAEIDAINLDEKEGDRLFSVGRYKEALKKYQNCAKRGEKAELFAVKLNNNGDELFYKENYNIAFEMFERAAEISTDTKQKALYERNQKRTETIICDIAVLDALWGEAWQAENDYKTEIANDKFQRILNEAQQLAKSFPTVSKFKTYINLAKTKMEGNDLFNEGKELHDRAVDCSNKGQLDLARAIFKEAKKKFQEAMEKFVSVNPENRNFGSRIDKIKKKLEELDGILDIDEADLFFRRFQNLNNKMGNEQCDSTNSTSEVVFGEVANFLQAI